MYAASVESNTGILAIAPMMEWTDRHCRTFHRILTKNSLLYTEMVTTGAVRFGERERILGFSNFEQPVACQLGGSNPHEMAESARIAEDFGYAEVNMNVGCPSDRVQSGRFGACLMKEPELVGECVNAMKSSVNIPVTVKCRLGVDDQDIESSLDDLADNAVSAGVDAIWVHARKAHLKGLNPKQNRDVPPLDYDRVYRLKLRLPGTFIGINGGIGSLEECQSHLQHVDGVMIGRAAYQYPWMLSEADELIYGDSVREGSRSDAVREFMEYVESKLAVGVRLLTMTRHVIGLYHGVPGAKAWRRKLTEGAVHENAGIEVIESALCEIDRAKESREAFAADWQLKGINLSTQLPEIIQHQCQYEVQH